MRVRLPKWMWLCIVFSACASVALGVTWLLPCNECAPPSAQLHGYRTILDGLMIILLATRARAEGVS